MQQVAFRPDPGIKKGGASSSARSPVVILIVALILFAVAGLASGFSVGALTRPKQAKQATTKTILPTQPPTAPAVVPQAPKTIDIQAVGIGCPSISVTPSVTQTADNTTTYTIAAQVVDKSISNATACGVGKPLLAPGITCKIWITQDEQSLRNLKQTSNKMLTDINKLQNAFPDEKGNILLLNGNNQVQGCSPSGTTTWKYSIANGTNPGTYFVAVLADWQGTLQNWSWVRITIAKA